MKITLLGTGTPQPSLLRASSGYAVEFGADVLLFDLGPGNIYWGEDRMVIPVLGPRAPGHRG